MHQHVHRTVWSLPDIANPLPKGYSLFSCDLLTLQRQPDHTLGHKAADQQATAPSWKQASRVKRRAGGAITGVHCRIDEVRSARVDGLGIALEGSMGASPKPRLGALR